MAIQLQLRKGTKAQNDAFVGAEGELTYDTQTQGLRIHDGTTQGGHMIDTVVAWQVPTAENNYTWYRKYASGWVEQGGFLANTASGTVVSLLVEMANVYFDVHIQSRLNSYGSAANIGSVGNLTTTSFTHYHYNDTSQSWSWQVSGMAAE